MRKKQTSGITQKELTTRWGKNLERIAPLPEYPRPQLKRRRWVSLNGVWEYAIREDSAEPTEFDGEIVVPFSPECLLSGVGRQLLPGQRLWYRRTLRFNEGTPDGANCGDTGVNTGANARVNGGGNPSERIILHFGAVDQHCTVFLNGGQVGEHSGGYWPFSFDITDAVGEGENTLTVCVRDDSDTGGEAFGKQKLKRGGIWYTAQSGIWQTVWWERVPAEHIESLVIQPDVGRGEVEFYLTFSGDAVPPPVRIQIRGSLGIAAEGESEGDVVRLKLNEIRLWSPDDPFLYTVEIIAGDDRVESYFGMREFGVRRDEKGVLRFFLNGKPIFLSGVLDQGYWSDGMYTPPSDEAMEWEITHLKDMGFNMLRKHIKIEPLRWYWHCDRLGMIVWQDFVNGGDRYKPMVILVLPFIGRRLKDSRYHRFGRKDKTGRAIFERDMRRTVSLLIGSPSLAVWGPFNEGWGQFDACRITEELRKLDSSRPIDHASGWHDQGCGDFHSSHIYFRKYKMKRDSRGRMEALTEFGGYSLPESGHMSSEKLFGYRMYKDRKNFTEAVLNLYEKEVLPAVSRGLSVSVYTQVSDVEDEINGLFTYDREIVKMDTAAMKKMNRKLMDAVG